MGPVNLMSTFILPNHSMKLLSDLHRMHGSTFHFRFIQKQLQLILTLRAVVYKGHPPNVQQAGSDNTPHTHVGHTHKLHTHAFEQRILRLYLTCQQNTKYIRNQLERLRSAFARLQISTQRYAWFSFLAFYFFYCFAAVLCVFIQTAEEAHKSMGTDLNNISAYLCSNKLISYIRTHTLPYHNAQNAIH